MVVVIVVGEREKLVVAFAEGIERFVVIVPVERELVVGGTDFVAVVDILEKAFVVALAVFGVVVVVAAAVVAVVVRTFVDMQLASPFAVVVAVATHSLDTFDPIVISNR